MENRVYKIFISSVRKNMEKERKKLIESILFHKCLPITMEYFTGEHGVFSLNLCKTAIEESDAIILVLKDSYGSFVKREEVNACFPDGMPFKHPRKFSYTDFEYMYAKYLGKTIYVLIEKNKQISDPFQVSFIDSIKNSGFVSFFKDYNEFTSSSSIAINQILIECQKNNSLGLISAKRLEDFENLHNRICVLEDNANNGLAILQNYMGCLIYEDKLYFYVYKKMHLLRKKDRINFSIHMNSAESGFKGVLSVDYVKAKAYIRYKKKNSTAYSDFIECKISERSYGTEYLNCYINFHDSQNIFLPIDKDDELDILYTYQVEQKYYGKEIGRRSSIFFEDLVVELGYLPESKLDFHCVEENEGNYIRVDGKDSNNILASKSMVLEKCKNLNLFHDITIDKFIFKTIYLNSKKIINGFESTVHYYVRWG